MVTPQSLSLLTVHFPQHYQNPKKPKMETTKTVPVQTLPTEILEHVLRDLPLLDLVQSQQVCRRWTAVIGSSARLQEAMYKTAKPQEVADSQLSLEAARLNPLVCSSQRISTPLSPVHYFEDGCDTVANCPLPGSGQYPDNVYGVVASNCSIETMVIPQFKQRLNEIARCSLTNVGPPPSWMPMHVFQRQCMRLSITFQSLSEPGELKCITVENPKGVRLGDVMRSVYIDHVR